MLSREPLRYLWAAEAYCTSADLLLCISYVTTVSNVCIHGIRGSSEARTLQLHFFTKVDVGMFNVQFANSISNHTFEGAKNTKGPPVMKYTYSSLLNRKHVSTIRQDSIFA